MNNKELEDNLKKIESTIEALNKTMKGYAFSVKEYTDVEAEYKKAKNEAILQARFEDLKTAGEKEAWASNQVSEIYSRYITAEAKCGVKKERLRMQQNILNALQTINTSYRQSQNNIRND